MPTRAPSRADAPRAGAILALLALFIWVGVAAQGAVLPLGFTLEKVAETFEPWKKNGLTIAWEVQRYRRGVPEGDPQAGTLSLRRGRYRAESGEGALKQVRIFDNAEGGLLSAGRYAPMPAEAQASLPEGVFLRSAASLEDLVTAYGVDRQYASPGRMPIGDADADIPFKTVTRFGVPVGPDDLTVPQIWIEPHTWRIHRIIAREGSALLQVDYLGHGGVANDIPWLPQEIRVSEGGRMLYRAHLKAALDTRPTDQTFDLKALAQSGSP